MKLSKTLCILSTLAGLFYILCPVQSSDITPAINENIQQNEHLTNADLNHLLSILDDNTPHVTTNIDNGVHNTPSLNSGFDEGLPKTTMTPLKLTDSKQVSISTTKPGVIVKKIWRKIRKPQTTTSTPSPTTIPTTSTTLPVVPVTVPISNVESASYFTQTEKVIPTLSMQAHAESIKLKTSETPMHTMDRREDTNIENLKNIAPPSQQELVQQLSLLNTLLTSLNENSTKSAIDSPTANDVSSVNSNSNSESLKSEGNISKGVKKDLKMPSLSKLNTLISSAGSNGNSADAAVLSALLALGAEGSSPGVYARQTLPTGSSDTEATKAINEFLKQAAVIDSQNFASGGNTLSKFDNANGNSQDAGVAAASNQISSLLALLGSLNNIQEQAQQQNPSLNQLSQTNDGKYQQTRETSLDGLIGNQRGQVPTNSLTDLFKQQPQQAQGIDLGSLLASASQNPAINGLPGSGIFGSLGTLGSSIFSTVSGIFGGGANGKPRVRGVDTRLGLGYRFGDAADAQIMWDVGPQLFTDTIKNELRTPSAKSRAENIETQEELINTQSRAEKQLQQIVAAKRQLQNQMEYNMQNHLMNQRSLFPVPESTKKPLSLLDIWNAGKEKVMKVKESFFSENPFGLLAPPSETAPILPFDDADLYQMAREKNLLKRSSAGSRRRSKPRFGDSLDDSLNSHSTLTDYEKMLLSNGKDVDQGSTEPEVDEESRPHRRPSFWNRMRPRPRPKRPHNSIKEESQKSHHPRNKLRNSPVRRPFSSKPSKNPRRRRPGPPERWNKNQNPVTTATPYKSNNVDYKDSFYNTRETEEPNNNYNNAEPNDFNRPHPLLGNNGFNNNAGDSSVRLSLSSNDNYNDANKRPGPPYSSDDDIDTDNGKSRSKSRPNNDDSGHRAEDRPRPQYKKPLSQRNRPTNTKRRRNSGFSLSRIFNLFRGKSASRPRKNNNNKRPNPKTVSPPNRRQDEDFEEDDAYENNYKNQFETLTENSYDTAMSESNDRFQARNQHNFHYEEDPMNTFSRKSNRVGPTKNSGGVPLYELYEADSESETDSEDDVNPESNDSFLRRNAVAVNPKLRDTEKQKLLQSPIASDDKNSTTKTAARGKSHKQRKSVMSFVRNYLSSKKPPTSTSSPPTNKTSSTPSRLSTLTKFLTNPSALNPLTILPIGRRKRPGNDKSNTKTKLTVVDGELKIVNSTSNSEEVEADEPKPVVHVGEDMSFEELSKVFGAMRKTKGKGKKKLKIKIKKPLSRHDEDEEDEEGFDEAEEKVEKGKTNAIYKNNDEDYEDEVADDDTEADNDDVKGIFIDIESGEVNVMKPVASLTSFEPKKESSEEEIDDYEDGDGDGIADADMKRKQEIFSDIQSELKRNFNKMKKAQAKAEAKQKRKEELAAKGMDESMDVVSKYFDMIDDSSKSSSKSKSKS